MTEQERLSAAVKEGDLAQVERMLEADGSLALARPDGVSIVLLALYHGRRELAEFVSARRHDLDVHELAALGRLAWLRELIERAPDEARRTSLDGNSPLGLAALFGHDELARSLLDAGADPREPSRDARRTTALHLALSRGSLSLSRLLLDRGADVNAREATGRTPLHAAAEAGRRELAALLVERGADPAVRDREGNAPADLARANGHFGLADWLSGVGG